MPSRANSRRRAGVTLVELLVVISILLGLAVLLVRVLPGVLESRRVREAARLVNVFLGTARNRAVEIGRPVGVIFYRDPSLPQACVKLQQAEVPPPYAGDYQNSRILFMQWQGNVASVRFCKSAWDPNINDWKPSDEMPFPAQFTAGGVGEGLVNVGDQLQLNYQGHIWIITPPAPGQLAIRAGPPFQGYPTWLVCLSSPTGGSTSNIPTGTPLPFQFFRQPVASSVPPVTLPAKTVVDLFDSGTDSDPKFMVADPNATPVTILFSPTGAVQGYYYLCPQHGYFENYHPAVGPLFFLVGRRDRVTLDVALPPSQPYTTPAEDGRFNVRDTNNVWVAVNPQTGMVTTTEVASAPGATLAEARRFAREAQRMGGQ